MSTETEVYENQEVIVKTTPCNEGRYKTKNYRQTSEREYECELGFH